MCVLLHAATAHAADVTLRLPPGEAYLNVPIQMQIVVQNAEQVQPPELPPIPDVTVERIPGENRSSQISMINGRVTRSVTLVYTYRLIPRKLGRLVIPPIEVRVDGKIHHTAEQSLSVVQSQTGDLLFVDVISNRQRLYVGEEMTIQLQIWLKPYRDRQYRLSEEEMWQTINHGNSNWGPFAELLNERGAVRVRSDNRKDESGLERLYYVYELKKSVWTESPGQFDPGEIMILVNYPTQVEAVSLFDVDLFSNSRLRATRSKPISATAEVAPIDILPVPKQNRPDHYTGAVGSYSIQTSAIPTQVAVGDPITLSIIITGDGRLEALQPPPLPELPELSKLFKIPSDPMGGVVNGNRKEFTQSLRPRSQDAAAIPPIPFSYFDPREEKFVTVTSQAIPIQVEPAETLSLSEIVNASGAEAPGSTELREFGGGILANYTNPDQVLSQQAWSAGWGGYLVVVMFPVIYFASMARRYLLYRVSQDRGWSRRRNAHRRASRALDLIQSGKDAASADRLTDILVGYIADRCDFPPGGLTRPEIGQLLARRAIPEPLVRETDELLGALEQLKYAGMMPSQDDLVTQIRQCIQKLQKENV